MDFTFPGDTKPTAIKSVRVYFSDGTTATASSLAELALVPLKRVMALVFFEARTYQSWHTDAKAWRTENYRRVLLDKLSEDPTTARTRDFWFKPLTGEVGLDAPAPVGAVSRSGDWLEDADYYGRFYNPMLNDRVA